MSKKLSTSTLRISGWALLALLVSSASLFVSGPVHSQAEATRTLPENGAVVEKPVRSIRIWFDSTPDVDKSELTVEGPGAGLSVQGTHTMGEDDLMARLSGPMPDGEYTIHWKTTDGNGKESEGSYTFTVKRGGGS